MHMMLRHVVDGCVLQKNRKFTISALMQTTVESAVGCVGS